MIMSIIYIIGGIIEALVGVRFVLRLLGANPDAGFVHLIYSYSTPLIRPFAGIFGQEASVINGQGAVATSVFDWTALIALVVYGIAVGIVGRVASRPQR